MKPCCWFFFLLLVEINSPFPTVAVSDSHDLLLAADGGRRSWKNSCLDLFRSMCLLFSLPASLLQWPMGEEPSFGVHNDLSPRRGGLDVNARC